MKTNPDGHPTDSETPRYLSRKSLAYKLDVSTPTVDRLYAAGELPCPIKLGNSRNSAVRWLSSDIDAWLESKKVAKHV